MTKQTINLPPFPMLTWADYCWTGEVVLRSWEGFQSRRGAYGSISSRSVSDGSATLTVTTEDDDSPKPPRPEQVGAFQFLLDNERAIAESVLQAIFAEYPAMQDSYGYDEEEAADLMPDIEQIDQLRSLIGLSNVHVLNVAKAGIA